MIFKPSPASAASSYYYLHVSSYQKESLANKEVDQLEKKGYSATARREKVPNKGYWYRVYVGPFTAHMEAYLKAKEMKQKKIVDYAAIKKTSAPIGGDSELSTPTVAATLKPPKVTTSESVKEPAKASSSASAASKSPEKTKSSTTKKKTLKKYSTVSREGSGRNMGGGKVALGFRQTYQEVEPDLTNRILTTSDGTTTTTQNVPITGTENERTTTMYISSLYFRWGLTDWFEIFGSGGGSYYELSDVQPAYGGGLRINLFDFNGFYGALQGEYDTGKVEYDYISVTNQEWHKEADYQEVFAKGELGLARPRYALYVGGSYLYYQEDTVRRLITNIPAPYTSYVYNDELEEKSFGAYGGVTFNLTPSFLLNIEGQGINKTGVFGSLEYQF